MRTLQEQLMLALAAIALCMNMATAAERTVYFVPDALGSPIAAMDEAGNVVWRESHSPHGARQIRAHGNTANPAYTGKPEDTDTGLVYMGARWYDPASARFTGIDPEGFHTGNPQSFGRYLYANNAPYVYVDPNGEVPVLVPVAIFLAREGAGFAFESATGLPAVFTMKGLSRAISDLGASAARQGARNGGTVLWTGSASARHEAASFAEKNGGHTLEMTTAGKHLEVATSGMPWTEARPLWAAESRNLVEQAEGVVDVFVARSGIRKSSIFLEQELPAARLNDKITGLRLHPAGAAGGN